MAETPGHVTLSTPRVSADVDLANGNVSFRDAAGRAIAEESGPAGFAPVTIEGRPYVAIRQQWNRGTDEGLFGLGQHQNGQMNYNGEDVELAQHNIDVGVPFLVSTRNYGILWDNNSITRFGNPEPYGLAGADDLRVTGENGVPGWSATYSLGDRVVARRSEPAIDYQYLDQPNHWPAEVRHQHRPGPARGLDRPCHVEPERPAPLPALRLLLFQALGRRAAGARQLAAELEPLVPQFRPAD